MLRRIFLLSFVVTSLCLADYITSIKSHLAEGTLSGFESAYDLCQMAKGNPGYVQTREFKFLDALSTSAMLVVREDGGAVDSFRELAGKFGLEVLGDEIEWLEFDYPLNNRQSYEIPEGAPDEEELENIVDTWLKPALDDIFATLDSITNPEGDEFEMFFTTDQTGRDNDIRLGYGEVLLYKGVIWYMRASLNQMPYDREIADLDQLIENITNNCFGANKDLLVPNPTLLKILPTPNDPAIGTDILMQNKGDVIMAIDYLIDAIRYIQADTYEEIGVDRVVYLTEEDSDLIDKIIDNFTIIRDSLTNDTVADIALTTSKTYSLLCQDTTQWDMTLHYDIFGEICGGSMFMILYGEPQEVTISDGYNEDGFVGLDLEYIDNSGYENGGYFEFNFDVEELNISDGYAEFWSYGSIFNITGAYQSDGVAEEMTLDLNPIYGSVRYPAPVSPRDMLPEFDQWNKPIAGTVGAGLGNDATLGGVLPEATQTDWQATNYLQPTGQVAIPTIDPWQLAYYSDFYGESPIVLYWLDNQLVFEDVAGDVDDGQTNADIQALYMGNATGTIVGEIIINDFEDYSGLMPMSIGNSNTWYEIIFSPSPTETEMPGAIRFTLSGDMGSYQKWYSDSYGYGWWEDSYDPMLYSRFTDRGIMFYLESEMSSILGNFPSLSGKFITVNSYDGYDSWDSELVDFNQTSLRLGAMGKTYGNVASQTLGNSPIYIQACTNPYEPDESSVCIVRIDEPGDFELDLPLGFQGYIRVFTPIFADDNPFEANALKISTIVEFSQWKQQIYGLGLSLEYPEVVLPFNEATIDDIQLPGERMFAFDALENVEYQILANYEYLMYAEAYICSPDGNSECLDYWMWQWGMSFGWTPEVSGRYFIVFEPMGEFEYQIDPGEITILITSEQPNYLADIANQKGIGAKDGVVDYLDLMALSEFWLGDFGANQWAAFADIDSSMDINLEDLSVLAGPWLNSMQE